MKKNNFLTLLFFLLFTVAFSQEKVTLSGIVKDQKSNETLIGVTISFQNSTTTRTSLTNEYGFYSISLPKGEYRIEINSLSFDGFSEVITLESNTKKDLFLIEKSLNALRLPFFFFFYLVSISICGACPPRTI